VGTFELMATVSQIALAPAPAAPPDRLVTRDLHEAPVVPTDAIHVVFTTAHQTLAAIRVAAALGRRFAGPLRLIQFRTVPYPLRVDAAADVSATETAAFVDRVKREGIEVQVRVYLCRSGARALSRAFKPRSLIVIGGRRSWWPTASERLRRRLEAAGHFVLFVDASWHPEPSRA
jgi:hypothetical protein